MKRKKNIVVLLAVASLLIFNISSVFAADDFTVTSGGISIDAHVAGFTTGDTWAIGLAGTELTSSESGISITDLTGTNAGWIFTVSFTDFTATLIDDPSVAAATLSLNVDVEDWMTMTLKDSANTAIVAGNIPATDGTAIVAANYTVTNTIAGSGNVNILEIEPGYGAGLFDFQIDYTITLDDWLPDGTTITSTSASGLFASATPVTVANASQKYQIFVGTYETTITYSVASNPA